MIKHKHILLILLTGVSLSVEAQLSQIEISRIEMMPNEPAPFNMRDWAQVAIQYDSFIYDIQKTGQFLPVLTIHPAGVNYLQNPTFGLHSYVGTNSPQGREAINVLPSLVGATLVGADKTNQFGQNWVLMSQDYFNKNNGEFIYTNNPGGHSGGCWWYDMMPNIYFYQLYELYPGLGGDEEFQFTSIANRLAESVRAMGGSDTPWQKAFMNYRAWNLLQMEPNDAGVKEPEAAGAYAWILYHAWKQTGNPEYLKGAEWSMEFLSDWTSNPAYELQLSYSIYAAAKMNAEINTDYEVEKMVNWAFDKGPLRGWGSIVGKWNGFDVDGLIGEANDNGNDYAFQMNGSQQAGALVPMVRYDKRFARAIGKWILNLANASRLFYPGFLPNFLQDASAWSDVHDPERVVGYEGLREKWQGNSPFSTGDALRFGWANTNLGIYSTSSIGYLGAILEKTNDPKILKIDLLKTDFFKDEAYPTYLLFNPYNLPKIVELAVGNEDVDIYEALTETFFSQSVNGIVNITIPANEAVVLTIAPANGIISYDKNKMLIDGVIVDYMQTAIPFNYVPRIQALVAEQSELELGDSTTIFAKAFDKDSENLTYTWTITGGSISGSGAVVKWQAPSTLGDYEIKLIVTDETNNKDTATVSLSVVLKINEAPQIMELLKSASHLNPGETLELQANAFDPNDDPLTYDWTASGGNFTGNGSAINWTAPTAEGVYQLTVTVSDDGGLSATKTTSVWVKIFEPTSGDLIAWYPFPLNGNDISGNQLNGNIFGAIFTDDYNGKPESALLTDGINDRVTVENDALLNFQNAITVSCWFNARLLPDRETFLLSHGSWQNRWKISITPEKKIRWTVNTLNSIGDLDSDVRVQTDSFYHLTVTYDGAWMALYLNGELQSFRPMTGNIRTTTLPFLMAQMLPDNIDYNYKGIIDEVKIFDYALTPTSVSTLYNDIITTVRQPAKQDAGLTLTPNPASDILSIRLPGISTLNGTLSVFDIKGQLITEQPTGSATEINLMVSNWQSGMYIVIFKTGQTTAIARFVKL